MLSAKLRRKLLMKWAQVVPGAPASPPSPPSPTAPASPTAPTEPQSTQKQTQTPPPGFDPTGGPWAWLTRAYNPETVRYLSFLLSTLNTILHYTSNGKYNLKDYQNNINGMDESAAGSDNGKNAVLLTKMFYHTFLNNGQPRTPTASRINTWVNSIINSQPLQQLSQLNPTGPAARFMKLNDSLRQSIVNNLTYIRQSNPVHPGQEE